MNHLKRTWTETRPDTSGAASVAARFGFIARRFIKDASGSVLIYVGLTSFVFLGFAGLAVDVGHWYASKRTMQSAADAAALGGVFAVKQGSDKATIVSMAKNDAALNGYDLTKGAVVTINNPPSSGPYAGDTSAVEAIIQQPVPGFFSKVVFSGPTTITARAVAAIGGSPVCIQALDPSAKSSFKVNSGTVFADDCAVQVNSSHGSALDVSAQGTLDTAESNVTGGYFGGGIMNPTPNTGMPVIADPYVGLSPPTVGACDYDNIEESAGTHTLTPGVYCGGIVASSTAHFDFEPGLYIITAGVQADGTPFSGELKTSGIGSVFEGDGVTIYFDGNSVLSFTGQSDVNLSAPTSGPYAGILLFGDPNAPTSVKNKISGNGTMTFDGLLYFPNSELSLTGNAGAGNQYLFSTVVARMLKFGGNGTLNFDGGGGSATMASGIASLTE